MRESNNSMVFKFFPGIKKYSRGITLVEIIVVIFVVTVFSVIIISDFPKIQRQFALSRSTHKLAQDLRKTQDLGMSGAQMLDMNGNPIKLKGYGVYIDFSQSNKQYIIYADVADANGNSDQKYTSENFYSANLCKDRSDIIFDCVVEIIDISKENPSLYIKNPITNVYTNFTSINFNPPVPTVKIDNFISNADSGVGIVLGLSSGSLASRTVWVNVAGLINVQ